MNFVEIVRLTDLGARARTPASPSHAHADS